MRKFLNEKGAVAIVEATIVFPVMFFVIFLLIFMGNAYFQKCRVEAIVTKLTLDGAAWCADPMLEYLDTHGGEIPELETAPSEPYRYFTGMSDIESKVKEQCKTQLGQLSAGGFVGMKPYACKISPEFKSYFLYSTFQIDLEYKITAPVKLLGQSETFTIKLNSHIETAVADVPEFMRNINMVEDYMEQTAMSEHADAFKEKMGKTFEGVKKFLSTD